MGAMGAMAALVTGGVIVDVVGETAPGMAKPASALWESAEFPPVCVV
jgi:hypothetical protein